MRFHHSDMSIKGLLDRRNIVGPSSAMVFCYSARPTQPTQPLVVHRSCHIPGHTLLMLIAVPPYFGGLKIIPANILRRWPKTGVQDCC